MTDGTLSLIEGGHLSACCPTLKFGGEPEWSVRKFHDFCYIVTPLFKCFGVFHQCSHGWQDSMTTAVSGFWSVDAG